MVEGNCAKVRVCYSLGRFLRIVESMEVLKLELS
jgi:hypothetical protein